MYYKVLTIFTVCGGKLAYVGFTSKTPVAEIASVPEDHPMHRVLQLPYKVREVSDHAGLSERDLHRYSNYEIDRLKSDGFEVLNMPVYFPEKHFCQRCGFCLSSVAALQQHDQLCKAGKRKEVNRLIVWMRLKQAFATYPDRPGSNCACKKTHSTSQTPTPAP